MKLSTMILGILLIGAVFTIGIVLYKVLGNMGFESDFAPLLYLVPLLILTVIGIRRWSR
jgi:hypothetical protein